MAGNRQIKTPGVTAEQAEESLDAINSGESEGEKEPSQEELLRQELAEMRAQMAELKKSTQPEAPSAAGVAQPKKRIPVLTEKGWSTKEAD
jgi:DNA-binding transcriptional MerR regulator